jgi:hypothetical protein
VMRASASKCPAGKADGPGVFAAPGAAAAGSGAGLGSRAALSRVWWATEKLYVISCILQVVGQDVREPRSRYGY